METEVNKLSKREDVWIIEILMNQSGRNVNLYLLFMTGDIDTPFIKNTKLIFFTKDRIIETLNKIGVTILPIDFDNEIDLICDINKVLTLVTFNNIDKDATLINFLNIMFDIINALKILIPNEYKDILYLFANHLTFNRRFGSFLKQNNISRENLVNAIYWLNGSVITNAEFDYCTPN